MIIVCTCERKGGVSYLSPTLKAIDEAGGTEVKQRIVLSDGPLPSPDDVPSGWAMMFVSDGIWPKKRGSTRALWCAFEIAAKNHAERLCFFEDDLSLCRNAVERMLDQKIMDPNAFVTFFDTGSVFGGVGLMVGKGGLYQAPIDLFFCTQAMVFPRHVIEWLAEHPPVFDEKNDSDLVLKRVLKSSPWTTYGIHMPSLVQHIGRQSAIFDRQDVAEVPTAPSYQGDGYDARRLRPYSSNSHEINLSKGNGSLLIVTTAPRPRSYLAETLASLDRAGADLATAKLILVDGPALPSDQDHDWPTKITNETGASIGAKHSLWAALKFAAERNFERLLFFEDDIVVCKNAVRRMLSQVITDDTAFISYFDRGAVFESFKDPTPGHLYPGGLYKTPAALFQCAQALLFPKWSIDWLASQAPPELAWCGPNDRDTSLNHILRKSPFPFYAIHMPSIVDHVGLESAIFGRERVEIRAASFQGEDFDALSLPSYIGCAYKIIEPAGTEAE